MVDQTKSQVDTEEIKLAREVVRVFGRLAISRAQYVNEVTAITATLRPYLQHVMHGYLPRYMRNNMDLRRREWLISLQWYRNAELVAESDGLRRDTGGTILHYGGDMVTGLDGAAELVAEYAVQIGAPAEFAAEPMRLALANLRPTISRQGGRATMRRMSECRQWNLVAHVFREDALPRDLSTLPSTLRRKIEPAAT